MSSATPEVACEIVRSARPMILRKVGKVLAEKLLEGLAEKDLAPGYGPWEDTDSDQPPRPQTGITA